MPHQNALYLNKAKSLPDRLKAAAAAIGLATLAKKAKPAQPQTLSDAERQALSDLHEIGPISGVRYWVDPDPGKSTVNFTGMMDSFTLPEPQFRDLRRRKLVNASGHITEIGRLSLSAGA